MGTLLELFLETLRLCRMITVPGGMTEVTGYSVIVIVEPVVIVDVVVNVVVSAVVRVVRSQVVPS